ncbi:MAG: hypothetical protein Kow009_04620 [Spirochaetales bacterium]
MYQILPAILMGGVATWFGVNRKKGVEYVKAAFPLYLFLLLLRSVWPGPSFLQGGVLVSLALCTVADFLLGRPDNTSVFPFGLAGFLLGYLIYGVSFFQAIRPGGAFLYIALVLGVVGILQYRTLRTLPASLRIPVVGYVAVVSFFLASASTHALQTGSPLPFLGALLIYLSDSLIAHNLFRSPLKQSDLWILPPYYVGQICIVLSVLGS